MAHHNPHHHSCINAHDMLFQNTPWCDVALWWPHEFGRCPSCQSLWSMWIKSGWVHRLGAPALLHPPSFISQANSLDAPTPPDKSCSAGPNNYTFILPTDIIFGILLIYFQVCEYDRLGLTWVPLLAYILSCGPTWGWVMGPCALLIRLKFQANQSNIDH